MTELGQSESALDEIERAFPNEWVLVEETAWDEMKLPVRGRALAHSSERSDLTQQIRQIARQHPGVKLFSFYAGKKIPDGLVPIL